MMDGQAHDVASLLTRIERLETELAACRATNDVLNAKVALFTLHPTIAAGIKGVTLVAKLLKQPPTTGNAPHDIGDDVRVEVKYARLTKNGPDGKVLRWTWGAVLGFSGKKEYERLILVGEKDPDHAAAYLESGSPYVLFDVPFDDVCSLATSGGNCNKQIRLSSNPKRAKSRSRRLYSAYQVTHASLESTYAWLSANDELPGGAAE